MKRRNRWMTGCLLLPAVLIGGCAQHVVANPLIYNESYWEHAHCIAAAELAFAEYHAKNGAFPSHVDGYGDALLLLPEVYDYALTGPGYTAAPFKRARARGENLNEAECGRTYIQGLSLRMKSKTDPILLYDKLPTPGGDHCHYFFRLWTPLGREVLYMRGGHRFVSESAWPKVARQQVATLIELGFTQQQAEACYRP